MTITTHRNQVYTMHTAVEAGRCINQAHLRCGQCRRLESINMRPDMPPDQVLKKFRQKGWETDQRHAKHCICPECCKPKPKPELKPQGFYMTQLKEKLAEAMQPSLVHVRRILGIVEGHFDEDKGRYTGGYDDRKVAAELNLPWAMVAKVREESGLKIKGDPEVLAIKDDLATLMEMARDLTGRIAQLEARK